ncbi:hypothetical protein AAMO2058_000343300 [Amorphochlora amoebiformis]|mmetsp:Transcript_17345/g.27570  ORF Transcript_17345/g.27570 Transcript_17345/m.27570 type:complete len:184 (-) Transcript_17345:647-1198(-)
MSQAQPIKRSKPQEFGGLLSAAHSCPTFSMIPPMAPARKPLRASKQPPMLTLPSSPMFETEISRQRGSSNSPKAELSRSLQEYAGFSYPGMSQFLMSAPSKSPNARLSETKLSSSPTVFELLKRRASTNSSTTRRFPAPSFGQVREEQADDLDLQFDLTLDSGTDTKSMSTSNNEGALHPSLA